MKRADGDQLLLDLGAQLHEVHVARRAYGPEDPGSPEEDTLYTKHWALREAIDAIEATTLAGLRVKARAANLALEQDPMNECQGAGSFWGLSSSLIADVLRAGPSAPMSKFTPPPGFRRMLEELADLAVLLLDELDGDVDLEPYLAGSYGQVAAIDAEGDSSDDELSGDEHEPSLGSRDGRFNLGDQTGWAAGTTNDCEDEHDGLEPDHDEEPSLGSVSHTNQDLWAKATDGAMACYDLELELSDAEYLLGSPAASLGNQELWASGLNSDLEDDGDDREPDESGIGDRDGLDEQYGRHFSNGLRFVPADAAAVDNARIRLAAIMDCLGRGRRRARPRVGA